ncbi:hypothetical protein SARC_09307, partial [Sphaeroforma arctica JP610]
QCFSSVVGPNGSGKSNVIDSLLFVFGRRAKQIRQKRLSELIHNSDKFPNLDYCCVYVHFCEIVDRDDDVLEVVPGTEVIVARKADRRSTSTYYLNGKVAKVDDVTTLLKAKGIDLDHNRFLILQGEVESISMMKPKAVDGNDEGLLEYLEDLIGSDVFKTPITQAADLAEKLNDERKEKLARVKAVGKEKERLEGPMKEAMKYINDCNTRTRHQSKLYQLQKYKHTAILDNAVLEKKKAKQELNDHIESQQREKAEMELIESQYANEKRECDALDKEVTKTKNEFAAFERKDAKFREDLKHRKTKGKKLDASLKADASTIEQQQHLIKKEEEFINSQSGDIDKFNTRLEKEETILRQIEEQFVEQTGELKIELEQKQKELQPENRKMNELQSRCDMCSSELDIASNRHKQAQEKLTDAQERLANTSTNISKKEASITEMKARDTQCRKQLQQTKEGLQRAEAQSKELNERIRKEKTDLEGAKSSMRESSDRSSVLNGLIQQKNNGKIPGIIGPLGSLGTIPDEYDVAVTTACSALNHIVVDTVSTGQKCTEYLRSAQLGRATFLILEKQGHLVNQMRRSVKAPENVHRLFDLITPAHEDYLPAFYFALRNTLVANDMQQATRIANSGGTQHRVVTLTGELIDTSGTMSGGGNRVLRGGMKSKLIPDIDPRMIEQKQKELAALEQEYDSLRRQIDEGKSTVSKLNEEIKEINVGLEHAIMDIDAIKKQAAELPGLCQTLATQVNQTPEEKKAEQKLTKDLEVISSQLGEAKARVAELDSQIKSLQNSIMDVGGVRMKAQKAKIEGIVQEISTVKSAVTKSQVTMKSATKKIQTCTNRQAKTQIELKENAQVIAAMKEEFVKLDEDARLVIEAMNKAQELLESKEGSLQELTGSYEKKKAAYAKIRSVQVDLQSSVEDWTKQVQSSTATVKAIVREIKAQSLIPGVSGSEEEMQLEEFSDVDLQAMVEADERELERAIDKLSKTIKNSSPNIGVVAEFQRKETEYNDRVSDLERVTTDREAARAKHESLRKQRLDMFMEGFNIVTLKLKEMYQMITLGGDAELELVDSLDPFSEGIVFSVRPPKKSWKNISNLSGGEKTLSSLALVFALHHFKPTPLYVMDEIDAALDFRNVSIVANYIKERTKNAQFIIISLRSNMFELADRLVGIYKTENHTKTAAINPAKFSFAANLLPS